MAKGNININRGVQDPFYRYKMPRIMAKVEGKGNGIKTVIANMSEIAKALSRPPTYPTKFFGCELGAQTNFDNKNDRYIVNGEHDASKLQDILDGFIRRFVLCPECENPETVLTVKRQTIYGKCKACGHSYSVDAKHKLSTYIIKNPPPIENGNEAEKESAKPHTENGSPVEEANGEETVGADNTNGRDGGGSNDGEEDEDWASDPAEEKEEKLSGQMGKMVIDKDMEKSEEERLDMLHQFFIDSVKNESIQDSKKMVNEAERLELKNKAPLLLTDVLFKSDVTVVANIKKYRGLLLRFCLEDKKAQRYLLGGIEQVVQAKKEVLMLKTAHIIKALYDNDICEEAVLLEWGKKPSKKFADKEMVKEMIKVAKPVLKWLEEAEEGSEEEEEGDGVTFDDRSRNVGKTVVEEKEKGKAAKEKEGKENNNKNGGEAGKKVEGKKQTEEGENGEGDEVDIDNI